jgi:hypothetical protein
MLNPEPYLHLADVDELGSRGIASGFTGAPGTTSVLLILGGVVGSMVFLQMFFLQISNLFSGCGKSSKNGI